MRSSVVAAVYAGETDFDDAAMLNLRSGEQAVQLLQCQATTSAFFKLSTG